VAGLRLPVATLLAVLLRSQPALLAHGALRRGAL